MPALLIHSTGLFVLERIVKGTGAGMLASLVQQASIALDSEKGKGTKGGWEFVCVWIC